MFTAAQVGLMGLVEKYRKDPDSAPTKGWAPVFGKWEDENPFVVCLRLYFVVLEIENHFENY